MLEFNDQQILKGAGSVKHDDMKRIANERYAYFDQKRRQHEAIAADAKDIQELEELEKNIKKRYKLLNMHYFHKLKIYYCEMYIVYTELEKMLLSLKLRYLKCTLPSFLCQIYCI